MIFNHEEESPDDPEAENDSGRGRRSARLSSKRRLNYADQLANIESLQLLIEMRKKDKEEYLAKKKQECDSDAAF